MTCTKMLITVDRFFNMIRRHINVSILAFQLSDVEFVPYIQPIYSKDKLVGGEVLMRLKRNGVTSSPASIIEVMETSERINQVTCRLMSDVRVIFESYTGQLPDEFYLSFNICPRQLNSKEVVEEVYKLNKEFCGRITVVLEIVERGNMDLNDFALETIDQLACAGVLFAIDDFGSGSSCLKYIEHAGFSTIKIDKCLTVAIQGELVYSNVIDAIVILSKKLKLQIVAEGVESSEQLGLLQKKGIDFFQGFFLSRPISISAFIRDHLHHNTYYHY